MLCCCPDVWYPRDLGLRLRLGPVDVSLEKQRVVTDAYPVSDRRMLDSKVQRQSRQHMQAVPQVQRSTHQNDPLVR